MEIKRISQVFSLFVTLTFTLTACVACQSQQKSASAKSATAGNYVIGGEHFVRRTINDPQQGNMPAAALYLPETWKLQSKITWNYGWTENPVQFSLEADNPANSEAFFAYPMVKLESMQVPANLRQYVKNPPKQGERMAMGSIYLDPMQPIPALALFIKQVRGNVTNLKWVGQSDLPDLAKNLGLDPQPGQHGVAIKISYDLNGKPVEEAFYGVYYIAQASNTGGIPGAIKQTNWGLQALTSFRAPAGTLDKRMVVFTAITKSLGPLPPWTARAKAIDQQLVALFNQKLKQGYDDIKASQELAAQVMKNMDAFDKSINSQMAANRASDNSSGGSGGGGAPQRSAADKFDDNMRGVDTVNDPTTGGTKQLSYLQENHFTDGFGDYLSTNDPNADPNTTHPGNWQKMTTAQ